MLTEPDATAWAKMAAPPPACPKFLLPLLDQVLAAGKSVRILTEMGSKASGLTTQEHALQGARPAVVPPSTSRRPGLISYLQVCACSHA